MRRGRRQGGNEEGEEVVRRGRRGGSKEGEAEEVVGRGRDTVKCLHCHLFFSILYVSTECGSGRRY